MIESFKCTECRALLLYTGFYLFREAQQPAHKEILNHFMQLSAAIRILASKEAITISSNLKLAKRLLQNVVGDFPKFFGPRVSFVVHMLLHIIEDVENYGDLYSYAAYLFESAIGMVRREIKSTNGTELLQLVNRIRERGHIVKVKQDTQGPSKLRRKYYQSYTFRGATIKTGEDSHDCYCIAAIDGKIILFHFLYKTPSIIIFFFVINFR